VFQDAAQFVDYWKNVRQRTARLLPLVPEPDLEWTYAPGRFTLGDLFRHLAGIERGMYAETVEGRPSAYAGHGAELASGAHGVAAYVRRAHEESVAIFARLTPERLNGKCLTPAGTPITVWKWLRAMVEHEAHHRGQIYLMLAMRGIPTPPIYGLTSEEVRDMSRPLESSR
jgi:uncharacterized damage-inducible protein DinB